MESFSFILFRGTKRVTVKEDDMTTEKIGRIFQVHGPSLYITDDSNIAIFPGPDGRFSTLDLIARGHYEVHGESSVEDSSTGSVPATQPTRFSFHRPTTAAGSAAGCAPGSAPRVSANQRANLTKTFQRNIFIAELVDGKLETSTTLTVRFSEFEASVMGILYKVNDALEQEDSRILTDGQGNKIMDSEGTRGSAFWKQNARKIFAVKEEHFLQLQASKKRRLSRREDTGLDLVFDRIEEVVLASQGLQEVSTTMKELMEFANSNRRTTLSLTEAQAAAVRDAFACIVCKSQVVEPMVSSCCQSLVGCRSCIEEWQKNSAFCPKCRIDDFSANIQRLTGLADALTALGSIFWE
ncbi:uncharacterized protein LOC130416191 [Triplophysa dalaica]|uniref:uncharacterized protein LOC130416191 n=1 Tax=Triplophysa dalaica TaxID=1582913 RepID=UPI0024DFCA87|nr:uncharacterized protein LOC130416191 [Triplophysa dalaica]